MPTWKAAEKYMIKDTKSLIIIIEELNKRPELIQKAVNGDLNLFPLNCAVFLFNTKSINSIIHFTDGFL